MKSVSEFFEAMAAAGDLAKDLYDQLKDIELKKEIAGVQMPEINCMTFGQMIDLRHEIPNQDDYQVALSVGRVMTGQDVSGWPYIDYLPYMLRVLQYVNNSIKNEEKKLKYTPTADEKAAGIDRLNVFKEWGVVDSIAQRMHILHEQVYNLKYTDCFLMQWKDLELSKFERKYAKIINKVK